MNETDFYKDDIEKNIGTSFYKYSAIDLGMGCENCSECEKCEQKRRMRLQRKLEGEVYFSSPLDFNDIIDSQLKTHYNMDLESKRSVLKLRELFHKEIEENGIEWIYEYVADFKESKSGDKKKIEENVRRKQLENLGILCFTNNNINATMWGYYADNKGICIEYDTKNMIFDIVTSLVSEMSENLTSLLLEKEYDKTNRDISDKPNRTKFANKIFFDESEVCSSIKKNKKLMELSTEEQLNFVKNIYIKRLWGRKVEYRNSEELTKIESSLFENKNDLKVKGKYFTKNDFWQHEKEYRFILSLGGRKIIKLREGTIRSITFGYNTEMKTINYIKNIINNNQLGKGIEYKKIEIENNNLIAKEVINNTN